MKQFLIRLFWDFIPAKPTKCKNCKKVFCFKTPTYELKDFCSVTCFVDYDIFLTIKKQREQKNDN